MSVAAGGYRDGTAWAAGPDRVYGLLADAAMGLLPGDLSGVLALDAGAGTGAVARALRRRGARTVSSDLSPAMLAAGPAPAFAADIRSLPLGDGTIDLAVAAMVLSHLTDPGAALAELVRVTRPGGTVLATAFPAGPGHPVAVAANRALAAQGFRAPDWYTEMKTIGEARVGTAAALHALATSVGLVGIRVERLAVDLGPLDAPALVGWRLGLAHVAPYLAGLDPHRRERLTVAVAEALETNRPVEPLALLVLLARR